MKYQLYDLCSDEIGLVFQYLEDNELFEMGWVNKWFREISLQNFLWVGRISLPEFGEDEEYFVNPHSELRIMWIDQFLPSFKIQKSLLNQLANDDLKRVFEYLPNYELFSLGWTNQRLRKLALKKSIWKNRKNKKFKKLKEDYALELGETIHPKDVREEYFYEMSFGRRKEAKLVEELYIMDNWRKREYGLKVCSLLNDIYYPIIHNLTPCFLFMSIILLSIMLFLHFSEVTSGIAVLVVGMVLSANAVILGYCCHCGFPGIQVRCLCNEILLLGALSINNDFEINGSEYQQRLLFERLRNNGVKGPKGIAYQIDTNYEREEVVVKYGITLLVFFAVALHILLFFLFMYLLWGTEALYAMWGVVGTTPVIFIIMILACVCRRRYNTGSSFSSYIYIFGLTTICGILGLFAVLGGIWSVFYERKVDDLWLIISFSIGIVLSVAFCFSLLFILRILQMQKIFRKRGKWMLRHKSWLTLCSSKYDFPWWEIFFVLGSCISFFCFVGLWVLYFLLPKQPQWMFVPVMLFSVSMIGLTCLLCVIMFFIRRYYSSARRRKVRGETEERYQKRLDEEMNGEKLYLGVLGRYFRARNEENRYDDFFDDDMDLDLDDLDELEYVDDDDDDDDSETESEEEIYIEEIVIEDRNGRVIEID